MEIFKIKKTKVDRIIFTSFIFDNEYDEFEDEIFEDIDVIVHQYEDEDNIYEINEEFDSSSFTISVGTFNEMRDATISTIKKRINKIIMEN